MDDDHEECKCFSLAKERMAHEIATQCVNLIEIAVGSFHPEGMIDPGEAMLILAFIASDVIWRASHGNDPEAARLLIKHAAEVGRGLKVFNEADIQQAVH
jgi:hypothetical protein